MSVIEREQTAAAPTRPELDEVLREVNRIRTERGADPIYELPKGTPREHSACALKAALTDLGCLSIAADAMFPGRGASSREYVELPEVLQNFVCDFDSGEYPELIA